MKNAVFLNSSKVDFDQKLNLDNLKKEVNITLYEKTDPKDMLLRAKDQQIVITKEIPMGRELIEKLPSCVELICEAGTGYNNIDIRAARERNITVCNIPSYSSAAVAQLAFSFILSLCSSLSEQQIMIRGGKFDNFTKHLQVNHFEVSGKTLGVIGAGKIAGDVIKKARAFDMKVLVYSRTRRDFMDENIRFVTLEELLTDSDFVTVHCPLTEETRYLIDKEKLSLMKPEAYLINTSRGAIIKEEDLVEALRNKKIAGAALDVLEKEPASLDNPLFSLDNCILTPHIGWQCLETRQRLIDMLADNIHAYLLGKPINQVN
ncbi:NAD(P)-dependent oxidoreductase [Anaerocolumna xylanovorans]|uniref:Glycerate dehydrogenase n=1 Tax=Anaerocolumna xylanovorans DSM 12503 TaxID=1121345 RepID=A0A1M7YN01_9FIRM|nr:NAD(P)-dependent oxidoreductase [Anaerocolumna xylanovorans]SHO54041.1 glycerate dehydrogenase [Anaerocolumna xylanovorans DSM 12503]